LDVLKKIGLDLGKFKGKEGFKNVC
jgi:hypothetical protein